MLKHDAESVCPQSGGRSDRSDEPVCHPSDEFRDKNNADDEDAIGDELHLVESDGKDVKTGNCDEEGEEKMMLEDGDAENDRGKEMTEDEKIENDNSRIGLDSGYAWFVVLGAFTASVLGVGIVKAGGIFFLQFQDHFKASALKAAWPGSVMGTLQSLSGPFVSAVCSRYSVRTSAMMGSIMAFVGFVLNSLVDNFNFLFFCHSFLQGVGISFVLNPAVFILSAYFDKHRGFAHSLASAGAGVGTFAMVPLIVLLFDAYGFRGCFLILAGILSNFFVVAMLFRPLSTHQSYLLALRKIEEQNGEESHLPLKEIVTIPTATNSTIPQPTVHHKTSNFFCKLKSSIKICFPVEQKKKEKRKMFHFELLRDFSFLLYLLSTFFLSLSVKAFFMFIPAACIDKGLSKSEAALVLSIAGAVDIFGRIGCGFALDRPRLKPHRVAIFNALLYCVALWGFLVPFLDSFVGLVIVCTLMGTFFGVHISQRPVTLVDLLGKELLPSCLGIIRISQAFGSFVGPLLYGALRDVTGSYDIAFYGGSSCAALSGIAMTLSNVIFKAQQRRKERQQHQDKDL